VNVSPDWRAHKCERDGEASRTVKIIENAPPLDPELMKDMLSCLGEMPEEQRKDITGRSIGLICFLKVARADAEGHRQIETALRDRRRLRREGRGAAAEAVMRSEPPTIAHLKSQRDVQESLHNT